MGILSVFTTVSNSDSRDWKRPTLYRAPYGEYDNDMMAVFENELKHFVIQWDVERLDTVIQHSKKH